MKLTLPTWAKNLVTEADNETLDLKRVLALYFAGQFSFLGFHAVIFNHQPFDPMAFGTGALAILGGLGAAISLGKSAEAPA